MNKTLEKTITTTQKIIQIGSSKGSTLPAKELKRLGVEVGDEVEITLRKVRPEADDQAVIDAASSILERYHQDFKNLAGR